MQNLKFKVTKCDSSNPYLKEGAILTFPEGESHYLELASPSGGTLKIQAKYLELIKNGETRKEPTTNAQPPQEPNQKTEGGQTETNGANGSANAGAGVETGSQAPGGAVSGETLNAPASSPS